jgi:histidinol-phosphate aminotransferase
MSVLLDRNENRYGPAPACLDVLRHADGELLYNYTRAFQAGYYSDLSARLAEHHGVDEKRIILGYGCEDILKQSVHHFLAKGRKILIPSASWWYYKSIADEVGGITVEFPLHASTTHYEFDVEALLRMRRTEDPGLLLIASPNNPTGNVLARADLRRLLAAYGDVPFVLDQAYFGFTPDDLDDAGALCDEFPHLLILRTFSKLYALAGVRIGYAVVGTGLGSFQRFCARNLGYNRISERLALAALDSPLYYANVARRMAADRQRFYALFRSCPGCEIYLSEANFVLVKMPPETAVTLKTELDRQGLVIKFFREPGFENHARISLGTDTEDNELIVAVRLALGMAEPDTRFAGEMA